MLETCPACGTIPRCECDAPKWQPIETAPRDGSDIVVYRPKAKENYVPKVGVDWFDASYLGGKWMRSNQHFQPTHWMPLPDPPAGT